MKHNFYMLKTKNLIHKIKKKLHLLTKLPILF